MWSRSAGHQSRIPPSICTRGILVPKRSISRILFPIEIGWRSFLWADRCRSARAAYPRDWRRAVAVRLSEERRRSHAWPCSCWGLPGRTHCCTAGELLPRLFTLAVRPLRVFKAVCFCGPDPRVTTPGRYPAACSYGVRTFLRRIKSARDHLMLFGAIIVAPAMPHVKRSTVICARFDFYRLAQFGRI